MLCAHIYPDHFGFLLVVYSGGTARCVGTTPRRPPISILHFGAGALTCSESTRVALDASLTYNRGKLDARVDNVGGPTLFDATTYAKHDLHCARHARLASLDGHAMPPPSRMRIHVLGWRCRLVLYSSKFLVAHVATPQSIWHCIPGSCPQGRAAPQKRVHALRDKEVFAHRETKRPLIKSPCA